MTARRIDPPPQTPLDQRESIPPRGPPTFSGEQPPIGAVVNGSDHRTTIVLPRDLREQLVERAQAADRTLSAEIRVAIREHVARPERAETVRRVAA